MLTQFGVSTNEIYQEDFLIVAILNLSMKAAMTEFFRRVQFPQSFISWKPPKLKC